MAGFPVLLVPGLLFLLFGTWQAVRQRENLKRLICWGALQDAGVVCIAMACPAPTFADALPLFILFQAATRLLALCVLGDLAKGQILQHGLLVDLFLVTGQKLSVKII